MWQATGVYSSSIHAAQHQCTVMVQGSLLALVFNLYRCKMLTRISNQAAKSLSSAAAQYDLQRSLPPHQHNQPSILLPTAATVALPLVSQWLWVDSAAAATVCLDVPDWLVDPKDILFHSPVVAVGVAGLALILFPKLIRVRGMCNSDKLCGSLTSQVSTYTTAGVPQCVCMSIEHCPPVKGWQEPWSVLDRVLHCSRRSHKHPFSMSLCSRQNAC